MCEMIDLCLTTLCVLPNVAVTVDALEQDIDLGHRKVDWPPDPKFPKFPKFVYTFWMALAACTMATCAVIEP